MESNSVVAGVAGQNAKAGGRGLFAVRSGVLLFGAFAFAFNFGESVHELGHYAADLAYGAAEVGIRLDPFGGSRIILGSALPERALGPTCAAGPLSNLLLAAPVFWLAWGRRRPALLPVLIWLPVALIQEGVTFSLGLLTPGGDASHVVGWGVPMPVVLGAGIVFLGVGVVGLGLLLPLADLSPADSFARRYGIIAGGMCAFMLVRVAHSLAAAGHLVVENLVPFVFALLLALAVALAYRRLSPVLKPLSGTRAVAPSWRVAGLALGLAAGLAAFQLQFFT